MENSILYTFSTIAQALGGAFALLSAFVLFRFQSLDASMLNASAGLRSIWKKRADLDTYDTLRGLSVWPSLNKAIDAQIARMLAAQEEPSFEVLATKTRLQAGQSLHFFLTWTFWVAVSLTFVVMTSSVAIIPYAHEIAERHTSGWIHWLNLAGIVAFALCLLSYVVVIYGALMSRYGKHIIQPRIDALIKGILVSGQPMTIEYFWRGEFTNEALNRLHAEAFRHRLFADDRWSQVTRHSLGWVCARDDRDLVGFVNVAWDGGVHAFILDTLVTEPFRHQGIATEMVRIGASEARLAKCEWLHVDFEDHLQGFYFDECGFQNTNGGLIKLV